MNAVRKIETQPTATSIEITQIVRPKKPDKTARLTSKGIKKATAADPIRDIDTLKKVKEYLLTHGKTEWYGVRNVMAFMIGVTTGLRISDILNLRVGDVLNEDGTFKRYILVREQKTSKTNDPRLSENAVEAIVDYMRKCSEIKKELTFDDYLIQSERGGKLTKNQFYRIIHAPQEALKLEGHLSTHSMRKTFGYFTINSNKNDINAILDVQQMFNHNSSRTTLRYCGIDRDLQDKYYKAVDALFD